jgi:hypothetical protein
MAVVLFLIASMSGCESREQTVRIVAEDFRFTPSEVHVSSAYPIPLLVVNEGREGMSSRRHCWLIRSGCHRGHPAAFLCRRIRKSRRSFAPSPACICFIAQGAATRA